MCWQETKDAHKQTTRTGKQLKVVAWTKKFVVPVYFLNSKHTNIIGHVQKSGLRVGG